MDFYYYDAFDETLNYTLNTENKETVYQILSVFGKFMQAIIVYYYKNIIILNTFAIIFIFYKIKMSFNEMFNEIEQLKIDIGYCLPTNKIFFENENQIEENYEYNEYHEYNEYNEYDEYNDEDSDRLRVYLGKEGKCFHKNLDCVHLTDDFKSIEIENKYISRLFCKSCK